MRPTRLLRKRNIATGKFCTTSKPISIYLLYFITEREGSRRFISMKRGLAAPLTLRSAPLIPRRFAFPRRTGLRKGKIAREWVLAQTAEVTEAEYGRTLWALLLWKAF